MLIKGLRKKKNQLLQPIHKPGNLQYFIFRCGGGGGGCGVCVWGGGLDTL